MNKKCLIHKNDCIILRKRNNDAWKAIDEPHFNEQPVMVLDSSMVVLMNHSGHVMFQSSYEISDDELWRMLEEANKFYASGVRLGKINKIEEFKKAFDI